MTLGALAAGRPSPPRGARLSQAARPESSDSAVMM